MLRHVASGRRLPLNKSRWLWVPAFAGTTWGRSRALLLKLAGLAEAPEILRRDGFQRIRGDAETLQRQSRGACRSGHDVVAAQQLDLIRRQPQRARGELQEKRLQPGEP